MEKNLIEQHTAETILERGVRVTLPAPRFFRFFGRKEIGVIIRQPHMGTLLHVSRLALASGFSFEGVDSGDIDAANKLISQHTKTGVRIVAVVMLRSKLKIALFSGLLTRWLLWKLTPKRLLEMVLLIVTMSGVQDFTISIRLIRSMTVTAPRNLSPEDQGSQQAEQ